MPYCNRSSVHIVSERRAKFCLLSGSWLHISEIERSLKTKLLCYILLLLWAVHSPQVNIYLRFTSIGLIGETLIERKILPS